MGVQGSAQGRYVLEKCRAGRAYAGESFAGERARGGVSIDETRLGGITHSKHKAMGFRLGQLIMSFILSAIFCDQHQTPAQGYICST